MMNCAATLFVLTSSPFHTYSVGIHPVNSVSLLSRFSTYLFNDEDIKLIPCGKLLQKCVHTDKNVEDLLQMLKHYIIIL